TASESPWRSTARRTATARWSRSSPTPAMPGSERARPPSDPLERACYLERIRDAVLSGAASPDAPRDVVSASWRRSLDARVDPDHGRPRQVFGADELDALRGGHLLAPVLPMLRRTLLDVADEAVHMMIVTDARGHILWREGHADVLRRADDVALVEGTRWSEDAIGTNAMGTALASGRAVQIHSAEHLVRLYRAWTCAAAPIHDPDSGDVVAAVDLTGPLRTFHPSTLALVRAAAELAEVALRGRMVERDERLRARNQVHLDGLRGGPGALLTRAAACSRLAPAGRGRSA
ncbi:MAG: phytochrome sensor protein, partial [Actinomycetospora sp.]|nr:phytochrome sensor protein [Actinomycetospora sp.]